MVRIQTDGPNTSVRREIRAQWRAPLGSSADRHRQTPELCKKALSQVIVPPRAQASRRCETQAPLSGKPPSCAKRFGPLTPSACSGNLIAGDGTKNGLPAPNKELSANKKHYLTGKAPYKFESAFLQRGVCCEPDFRGRIPSRD